MAPESCIVFDTNCVLCSGMVAFVLAHERDQNLRFVGAWSSEGLALAARYNFTEADLDKTFLVLVGGNALIKSDAALAVLAHLQAPWRWLIILSIVPKFVRDAVYTLVARHRYQWFGRRENCTVVPPLERHRFIGVFDGTSSAS